MVFLELCGLSEAPVHGSVEYSSNRHTAYFTCDPGYYLSGNTSIPCNNGQWVGTLPACLDIDECGSNPCLHGATCFNRIGVYTCKCTVGFTGKNCETALHSDCCDVRTNYPSAPSGLYGISMTDNTVTSVYCDMDTTCGGWTVNTLSCNSCPVQNSGYPVAVRKMVTT